jgi:hypothetical protein
LVDLTMTPLHLNYKNEILGQTQLKWSCSK